jgi:hypothetical protein
MKSANTKFGETIRNSRSLILIGALAAVASTFACSSNSKPGASNSQVVHAAEKRAQTDSAVPKVPPLPVDLATADVAKPQLPKSITFKSRNYGVTFAYPRQYAFLSAKVVADGDANLQPKSDGHDGQFTLARIEVPKGFYPDSDLDNGYFILSLNQEIDQAGCEASLMASKDRKVQTDNINGVDFKWVESESGGHGTAVKMRNYVAFTNGTCYEVELGVKTSNASGMAREVDPDKVLGRLDSILKSVKIQAATQPGPQLLSANDTAQ